jgi:hypothetical protein
MAGDSLSKGAAGLTLVAVRSFLGTLLIVFLAGVVLAGVSVYWLRGYPLYAVIAAVVALVEAIALGALVGGKRALVMTLVHAVRSFQLGRSAVRLIFDRLLGGSERGKILAAAAERLPLAQAERRLTAAVDQLLGEQAEERGWFRRRLHKQLLGVVQCYTLSRFREDGVGLEGVDVMKVQAELETTIDDQLVSKFRSGLNLWTILALLGLPAVVAGQTYLLIALLNAK